MPITSSTNFVLVEGHGDRLITTIFGQPFYRSTGRNSHQADTWFPFNGINEFNEGLNQHVGLFIKPFSDFRRAANPLLFLLETPYEMDAELLGRLAGIDTICISYLAGIATKKGFWVTEKGKMVGAALEKKFGSFIGFLKQNGDCSLFENIPTSPQKMINRELMQIVETNNWLCRKSGREKAVRYYCDGHVEGVFPKDSKALTYRTLYDHYTKEIMKRFFRSHRAFRSFWSEERQKEAIKTMPGNAFFAFLKKRKMRCLASKSLAMALTTRMTIMLQLSKKMRRPVFRREKTQQDTKQRMRLGDYEITQYLRCITKDPKSGKKKRIIIGAALQKQRCTVSNNCLAVMLCHATCTIKFRR